MEQEATLPFCPMVVGDCRGDRCAWWVEDGEWCAIVQQADASTALVDAIDELRYALAPAEGETP